MRKLLLLFLILIAIVIGYFASHVLPRESAKVFVPQKAILKVAIVTDSHNDNDLLASALAQAKAKGVDFVIGLGDYTNIGTVDELKAAKNVFLSSGLSYKVTLGDHDEWSSRNAGEEATKNFTEVFGGIDEEVEQAGVRFLIVNNADIYKGITNWESVGQWVGRSVGQRLTFVFAHKTPYHPQSAHVMGEETPAVAVQAKQFMDLMEQRKIDGFFSGDLHFFAKFNSPNGSVKMTTIGAVTRSPNPQGPRYGIVTVYDDYSWDVEDIEIR